MKYTLLLMILFVCSCQYSPREKELSGELYWHIDSLYPIQDLKIKRDYLITIHANCDTILQIRDINTPDKLYDYVLYGKAEGELIKPLFVKNNPVSEASTDELWIVDNYSYLKKIKLSGAEKQKMSITALPGYEDSKDYNISTKEIYATPLSPQKFYSYFFFNPDSGYYWVDNHAMNDLSPEYVGYLTNLCINEKHESVVSAYRFSNEVQFYDMAGNLNRTFVVNDSLILPKTYPDNQHSECNIDIANTPKCFVDIYGTDEYVYILYDGSIYFSNPSTIYVFEWNGRLSTILKSPKNFKKIAIDETHGYVYGIVNEGGNQYIMKCKI